MNFLLSPCILKLCLHFTVVYKVCTLKKCTYLNLKINYSWKMLTINWVFSKSQSFGCWRVYPQYWWLLTDEGGSGRRLEWLYNFLNWNDSEIGCTDWLQMNMNNFSVAWDAVWQHFTYYRPSFNIGVKSLKPSAALSTKFMEYYKLFVIMSTIYTALLPGADFISKSIFFVHT